MNNAYTLNCWSPSEKISLSFPETKYKKLIPMHFLHRGAEKVFEYHNKIEPQSIKKTMEPYVSLSKHGFSSDAFVCLQQYPKKDENIVNYIGAIATPQSKLFNRYRLPTQVINEILELSKLKDGWDGGTEVSPKQNIIDFAINVMVDLCILSQVLIRKTAWPEMTLGFQGDIGLDYSLGNRELIIDISPIPNEITTRILMVYKNDRGRIIKTRQIDSEKLGIEFLNFMKMKQE